MAGINHIGRDANTLSPFIRTCLSSLRVLFFFFFFLVSTAYFHLLLLTLLAYTLLLRFINKQKNLQREYLKVGEEEEARIGGVFFGIS